MKRSLLLINSHTNAHYKRCSDHNQWGLFDLDWQSQYCHHSSFSTIKINLLSTIIQKQMPTISLLTTSHDRPLYALYWWPLITINPLSIITSPSPYSIHLNSSLTNLGMYLKRMTTITNPVPTVMYNGWLDSISPSENPLQFCEGLIVTKLVKLAATEHIIVEWLKVTNSYHYQLIINQSFLVLAIHRHI